MNQQLLALLLVIALGAISAPASATSDSRCTARSLALSAQLGSSLYRCHAKAVRRAWSPLELDACLGGVVERFERKTERNASKGCVPEYQPRDLVEGMSAYAAAVPVVPGSRCDAGHLKESGRAVARFLRAHRKLDGSRGSFAFASALTKVAQRFRTRFAAVARTGLCSSAGHEHLLAWARGAASLASWQLCSTDDDCEDGTGEEDDGCRSDCAALRCGDRVVDPLEACDDGNLVSGDGCRADCSLEGCGDGVLDSGEACDDGNQDAGDGCRADCSLEVCGDGIPDPGEACDDGNPDLGDGCRPDCTAEICGDSILDPGEQCESDGDCTPAEACSACSCVPFPASIELILDASAGGTGPLRDPDGIEVDGAGNVYVAACGLSPSDEGVWKVSPGGAVTKILTGAGDGSSPATCPVGLALDSAGNLFVACFLSNNVFQVAPGGAVDEVIGPAGAGAGQPLAGALDVAVDGLDQVYVTGNASHNVLVLRSNQSVDAILDGSDGLLNPFGIEADAVGTVFVAGFGSDAVYRISSSGVVDEILDSSGGGAPGGLDAPHGLALDAAGNLYVTGNASDNVLRRTPAGAVTEILDSSGDGLGNPLDNPTGIAVDSTGNVYVAAFFSDNLFQISPTGRITEFIDATGDGANAYVGPSDSCVAVDGAGLVYTTGTLEDNTFRITP